MKILKIIFAVLGFVVFSIVVGIGYVWYQIAFGDPVVPMTSAPSELSSILESETEISTTTEESISETPVEVPAPIVAPPVLSAPITVDTNKLTEAQKSLLSTLGIDSENISITPEMVVCAEKSLGAERLLEIQKGDTPSIGEGLSLLVCFKK